MDSDYTLTSSTSKRTHSASKSIGGASVSHNTTSPGSTDLHYMPSMYGNRSPSSPHLSAIDDLRADSDQKNRLDKENFDLKMKVYYLEENMKKMAESGTGGGSHSDYTEELRAENTNLRLQVEEKCIEMEQRNTLLLKAKTAIETLKTEINKLRSERHAQGDMEVKLRSVMRDNQEMEAKYKFKSEQLEVQVATLQQAVNMKDHGTHLTDEKLRSARQELEDARRHSAALEEDVRSLQKRLSESHTQLVEARSESDGLRIQQAEQADAVTDYKSMIAELQDMVSRLSQDREHMVENNQTRISSSTAQFESLIETIKSAAEQEQTHAENNHAKLVSELRETHRQELERVTAAKEDALRASRSQETTELFRMREDLQQRLQEKQEEVRGLKSSIDLDRVRLENALRDSEEAKSESRQRLATIDQLRTENATIEVLRVELRQSQGQCKELKERLQQDVVVEKNQLLSRIEVLSDNVETSRDTIRELEAANNSLSTEMSKIKEDMYEGRKRLDAHGEVTRENERMRSSAAALREEVKELSGLLQSLQAENKSGRESTARATAELDRLRLVLNASEAHANALDDALREEKSKHTAADAGLVEHRDLTSRLSHELEEERQRRSDIERRSRDGIDRLDVLRADIGKTCTMLSSAVEVWDKQLMNADKVSLSAATTSTTATSGDVDAGGNGDMSGEQRSKMVREYVHGVVSGSNSSGSMSNNDVALALQQQQADLLTTTIVRIERFRAKLDRLVNVKASFEDRCDKMLQVYESKIAVSSDRMQVQRHRLDSVEGRFSKIKHTMDRDNQKRSGDIDEMRAFRESVVSSHTQQMQSITSLLEKERAQNGLLRGELEQVGNEMREYREQAKDLSRMEDAVAALKARFNEVVESNRLLLLELDDRAGKYDRLKRELTTLSTAKADVQSELRSAQDRLHAREEETENLRRQISYLRSREIDPELERSFRETQSIMKSYRSPDKEDPSQTHGHRHQKHEHQGYIHHDSTAVWDALADRLSSLFKATNGLVASAAGAVDSFAEMSGNNSSSNRVYLRDTTELIFELLDTNAKLTTQLKRVSSEMKMEINAMADATSTSNSVAIVPADSVSSRLRSPEKSSSSSSSRSPKEKERDRGYRSGSAASRQTQFMKYQSQSFSGSDTSAARHTQAQMHQTQLQQQALKQHRGGINGSVGNHGAFTASTAGVFRHNQGQKQQGNEAVYDSEPERYTRIHPEATVSTAASTDTPSLPPASMMPSLAMSRQSSEGGRSAPIAPLPIHHSVSVPASGPHAHQGQHENTGFSTASAAYIPSRRGLKTEIYDSEPEEISQIHPAPQFTEPHQHQQSAPSPLVPRGNSLSPEVASRHRGWSESSVPPDVPDTLPKHAQVHPMNSPPHSRQAASVGNTIGGSGATGYTFRDSSPLTMSHFGGGGTNATVAKSGTSVVRTAVSTPHRADAIGTTITTTPAASQYTNLPQSRGGSASRASNDRLQRLGDDLQVLARKLDTFDSSSRVKY